MSATTDARSHLAKAEEFLAAAELALDRQLHNAATSDAVICGINAKDAVCLVLTGQSPKGDDHLRAADDLRAAGPAGRALAPTLGRLLKLKSRSQYQTRSMTRSDAERAVRWASALLEGAQEVVIR